MSNKTQQEPSLSCSKQQYDTMGTGTSVTLYKLLEKGNKNVENIWKYKIFPLPLQSIKLKID